MRKSQKQTFPKQDLSRKRLGDYGEQLVARMYEAHGFEVVARQWRAPGGELDLVLKKDRLMVFCEVKSRNSTAFGAAVESITPKKQLRLRNTAMAFLSQLDFYVPAVRFDVATVTRGNIEVFENAF